MRRAAASVRWTISSGSFPGTMVVRNATRVPGWGSTGMGSRASAVDMHKVATLTRRKSSMVMIEATGRKYSVASAQLGRPSG